MMERRAQLDATAVVLLIGCCALWGLNQVAAKVAMAEVPPLTQAAVRSAVAALLLWAWAAWRGIALFSRDGSGRAGVLVGVLFAVEFACIFVGLQFTSASRMVVFVYLAPFVVALGMPFIARQERLGAAQLAGLVLAFAGVAWAFAESFAAPATGPNQWIGDALGVAGAVLWGLTTLVIRATRLATTVPEKTLLYQLAVSAVVLGALAVLAGERPRLELTPLTWSAMAFQAVVVTFASYLAWFWLVRHYPATRLSAFTLLTPVFGLVAGVVLLDEPLTPRLVVALVAVCVGIAVVNLAGRPRTAG
ncbi:MAG: DMT family transporter [Ideonella sp.]|nr:DMT family transporter [Ideonella sp.]